MSEKHISTSPNAIHMRNQQKTISVEEKLDVISRLGNGERIVDICYDVRLAYSSVPTICDNADRITESAKSRTKVSAKRTFSRSSIVECIEKVLSTWIEDQDQCRMPASMFFVPARFVLFMKIYPKVIIMLNHLVQVQVGLAGSQRDIFFITLK
jgi:hypothetical protein